VRANRRKISQREARVLVRRVAELEMQLDKARSSYRPDPGGNWLISTTPDASVYVSIDVASRLGFGVRAAVNSGTGRIDFYTVKP
jgi:hypothetical protein